MPRRQNHFDLWFHVGHWPKDKSEQLLFIASLMANQARIVAREEIDDPVFWRQAKVIINAVNETLEETDDR